MSEHRHRPVLGVVGAGQLGRMMLQDAISLAVPLRFMAASDEDPAVVVGGSFDIGSAMHDVDLGRFAATCDVMTFEHEVVDLEGLEDIERGGAVVRPSASALRVVADKLGMRRAVEWADLPVPEWKQAKTVADLMEIVDAWPQCVVKLSRGGYDGRGVFVVDGPAEMEDLAEKLVRKRVPLLVEPLLDFDRELAVIVARRPGGEAVVYDPVETRQIDGQCRQVDAPAPVALDHAARVREIGLQVAESIGVVGLVAVELFEVGDELLINELAVRPHNTGHHSIDACVTSQFENHIRAVLDLPLGNASLTVPAAVMVNVVGDADATDPRDRLADAMAVDAGARIHLYEKESRPGRKIGHVTVTGTDHAELADRAWSVVEALGGDIPEVLR
jgi:5-(carboxyamino)imidazole ribonucleotide synthase